MFTKSIPFQNGFLAFVSYMYQTTNQHSQFSDIATEHSGDNADPGTLMWQNTNAYKDMELSSITGGTYVVSDGDSYYVVHSFSGIHNYTSWDNPRQ